MNKSPMEVKMEELADIADQLDYSSCSDSSVVRGFYRGFKAALDLPEVKALEHALKEINSYQWCPACKNEESRGIAIEALKSWKSFKGE